MKKDWTGEETLTGRSISLRGGLVLRNVEPVMHYQMHTEFGFLDLGPEDYEVIEIEVPKELTNNIVKGRRRPIKETKYVHSRKKMFSRRQPGA